ncbi:MAG: T9SS type A sorting domain-containing protein [Flavobacteriales bacterium]|nr:MAG: T9SS type A sorting domain-containing protein [Flavobacteriales bacterium]
MKKEDVVSPTVIVFPNPNRTGQLNFRLSVLDTEQQLKGQVLLYDVQGQLVESKLLHNTRELLEVGHLAQGLYHWEVIVDDHVLGRGKVIQY